MRTLVFLHGALGCSSHWRSVTELLSDDFEIYCPDFPGHGKSESQDMPYTISGLTQFIEAYVSENDLKDFILIGYSMGGYAALKFASNRPHQLKGLITVATKMEWSESIAENEIANINREKLQPVILKMQTEHGSNWPALIDNTHHILRSIGKSPLNKEVLSGIEVPLFVLRGERDKMVSAEESRILAESVDGSTYLELEGQGHLLERMDAVLLAGKLKNIIQML